MTNREATDTMTRNNTIDITDMTDAALDALLESRSTECVVVEHLTVTERCQLAKALGFKASPAWLYGLHSDSEPIHGVDYEGAILARQEADWTSWT